MKRIDTLTKDAKSVMNKTIELAERYHGVTPFQCRLIACSECPFHKENIPCYDGILSSKTADEWKEWLEEEVW